MEQKPKQSTENFIKEIRRKTRMNPQSRIAVLGAGMVGRTIALELSKVGEITSFDNNFTNLMILKNKNYKIELNCVDLKNIADFTSLLSEFDLVVSAVPGFMGYEVLRKIILAEKNCVDISFFPEDITELNHLAKKIGVCVIMDCGIAPGMSNLILGRYNKEYFITNYKFCVGGLPIERIPPFEYKAPFSPIDVIEEYIRPVRLRKFGKDLVESPLSEVEEIEFDGIGKLEGFNTDGLRSLLYSFPDIPNMSEKTLRYPGHMQKIQMLSDMGFFNKDVIEVTSRVLLDKWKMNETDQDITVMRVEMEGTDDNDLYLIRYDLIDTYDTVNNISSMSRTTAYTCTSVCELILKKLFFVEGVNAPEIVSQDTQCFEFILSYLRNRNIIWNKSVIKL